MSNELKNGSKLHQYIVLFTMGIISISIILAILLSIFFPDISETNIDNLWRIVFIGFGKLVGMLISKST